MISLRIGVVAASLAVSACVTPKNTAEACRPAETEDGRQVTVCQSGGSIRVLAAGGNLPAQDDPAMAAAVLSAIEPESLPARTTDAFRPSITAHDVMGCTMAPAKDTPAATMDLACTVRVRFVLANQAGS